MAKENKMSMPSGIGGLVRYFDEYSSNLTIKAIHVVFLCAAFIVLMLLLHLFA